MSPLIPASSVEMRLLLRARDVRLSSRSSNMLVGRDEMIFPERSSVLKPVSPSNMSASNVEMRLLLR